MASFLSKGSLERIFVACALFIVATSMLVFFAIFVIQMPAVIHRTMLTDQPREFVDRFEWQDWEEPGEELLGNHRTEFADSFVVRHGQLNMLYFTANVIQARDAGKEIFLDGQQGEVRIDANSRAIAITFGLFLIIWGATLNSVLRSIFTRRRMIKAGKIEPI